MVEFAFDIKHLFPQPIIRVQAHSLRPKVAATAGRINPLIPHYRQRINHQSAVGPKCQLSQILDAMGQLSAVAQGLRQPVTTAEKLAPDQVVYLMADHEAGRWSVAGLLKVGTKDLFLFDKQGSCRRADKTPAILDFYVHESRQRRGLGKQLFERMLDEQGWLASKCSVDRPSEKLLAFLGKHYGLVSTIPQGNNFVLYEGFFEDTSGRISSARNRMANGNRARSQSQGHHLRRTQMQMQQQVQQQQQNYNPRHHRRDILNQGQGQDWDAPRTFASMDHIQGSRARRSHH
ncbi:alpha-tubulin N-acetyltransferase 2 [Drosophila takahashii]|uniref:alpha-tubulin N-acetyltransferase 2 n=1 Tax=Drosophila takahashii TaxID=29030 RepID=UPI001CF83368|nr:alpha-tubulin N-acetyltransferase 2 [Drosophila takahashii]